MKLTKNRVGILVKQYCQLEWPHQTLPSARREKRRGTRLGCEIVCPELCTDRVRLSVGHLQYCVICKLYNYCHIVKKITQSNCQYHATDYHASRLPCHFTYRAFACILLPWKQRPFWCTDFNCAPKWPPWRLLSCCYAYANALY